jgi:hypothetical protein
MAQNTPPGPGVDASGQAVIDPTKNVIDRVVLETKRQDDLRKAATNHAREVANIRADHAKELRDRDAELAREIREKDKELRLAESARIDALRAGDIAASATEKAAQNTQALALAKGVVDSAEALRNQVDQKALASDQNLRTTIDPIQKRLDDLTRTQYEGVGAKGQVVESRSGGASVGLWVGLAVAAFVGLTGLLLTLVGIAITVIVLLTR